MSGILLHLHFKHDKIIFRFDIFSLKATSNWVFFSLLSLSSFPVQRHSQIANHPISKERQRSTVTIFPSLACREAQLCISKSGLYLTENVLQAPMNIFIAQISQVDGCFCQMLPVDASYLAPKEGEVKRYIYIWVSGLHTSLSIFLGTCNKRIQAWSQMVLNVEPFLCLAHEKRKI